VVLLVLGAAVFGLRVLFPPAGLQAEQRSRTRLPEEELVKRYILNNAEDPGSVTFLTWGPHLTRDEILALQQEAGIDDLARLFPNEMKGVEDAKKIRVIIRVRFKGRVREPWMWLIPFPGIWDDKTTLPEGVHDYCFTVVGDKLVGVLARNDEGDGWKEAVRRELAKRFPAINTGR
jgi:hypothetical protein